MTPEQATIYRAMSPAEKFFLAVRFHMAARELKAASFRSLHPDWPEERVQRTMRSLFLRAAS